MAHELGTTWAEAARDITIALLTNDKYLTAHSAYDDKEAILDEAISRATKIYAAVYDQIRSSYHEKATSLGQAAEVARN